MTVLTLLAAASMTFNLVCTGTEDREDILGNLRPAKDRIAPSSRPFREVYRLDLRQQRWCSGKCTSTNILVSVSRSSIIIEDPSLGSDRHTSVSRETGKYVSEAYLRSGIRAFRYGRCTKAPFGGFPTQQF
jgi:hypothetical protein